MELWVRSQNKEKLYKCEKINLEIKHYEKLIIDKIRLEEVIYIYVNNVEFGTYDTKERALEVLDEIQYRLITLCDSMNRHLYVYEMPKD